jgi:hypothetical protein
LFPLIGDPDVAVWAGGQVVRVAAVAGLQTGGELRDLTQWRRERARAQREHKHYRSEQGHSDVPAPATANRLAPGECVPLRQDI